MPGGWPWIFPENPPSLLQRSERLSFTPAGKRFGTVSVRALNFKGGRIHRIAKRGIHASYNKTIVSEVIKA